MNGIKQLVKGFVFGYGTGAIIFTVYLIVIKVI